MSSPDDSGGLWGSRSFRLLVASQTMNVAGDLAMFLVLAIWTKETTGSNSLTGMVYLSFSLPMLIGPLLGVFIDRMNHRRTLIAVDLVLAIATLALLGARDRHDLWIVYLVTLGFGLGEVFYNSARAGLVAMTVPEKHLPDANGVVTAVGYGLQVFAPVMGVAVYATFGLRGAAVLDSFTFAASALLLSLIRLKPDVAVREAKSFRVELREGWRYLSRDAVDVRTMTIAFVASYGSLGMFEVAWFPMIQDGLHRGPRILGLIHAAKGAALIVGGLTAGPIIRRFGERRVAGSSLLVAVSAFCTLFRPVLAGVFVGAAVFGIGLGWFASAYMTLVQRRTPAAMLGRVTSTSQAIGSTVYVAGLALASWVVPLVGFRPIFATNIAVFGASAFWLLRAREPAPSVAASI